jgi:hypothetical protein
MNLLCCTASYGSASLAFAWLGSALLYLLRKVLLRVYCPLAVSICALLRYDVFTCCRVLHVVDGFGCLPSLFPWLRWSLAFWLFPAVSGDVLLAVDCLLVWLLSVSWFRSSLDLWWFPGAGGDINVEVA